jgi:hypothetical protein
MRVFQEVGVGGDCSHAQVLVILVLWSKAALEVSGKGSSFIRSVIIKDHQSQKDEFKREHLT